MKNWPVFLQLLLLLLREVQVDWVPGVIAGLDHVLYVDLEVGELALEELLLAAPCLPAARANGL